MSDSALDQRARQSSGRSEPAPDREAPASAGLAAEGQAAEVRGVAQRPADPGAAAGAAGGQAAELAAGGGRPLPAAARGRAEAQSGDAPTAEAEKKEADADARAGWEAFLGKAIGGKLFEVVHEQVDPAQLTKYAQKGTKALADEFAKLGNHAFKDDKAQAEALNKFLAALGPDLKKLADEWVASESGQKVMSAISGWVEGHPKTVVTILGTAVVGAAIAAYLANMDPPALEKTFKLGRGFTAGGSIDFGPIQKIAVQAVTLSVGYETEGLSAKLSGKYDQKSDTYSATASAEARGSLGGGTTTSAKGVLTANSDGTTTLSVEGGLESKVDGVPVAVSGGLVRENGDKPKNEIQGEFKLGDASRNLRLGGRYDAASGSFTFMTGRTELDGRFTDESSVTRGADGTATSERKIGMQLDEQQRIGVEQKSGPAGESTTARYDRKDDGSGLGIRGHVTGGAEQGAGLGVTWSRDQFKAALDYEMKDGIQKLGLSSSMNTEEGFMTGFDLKANLTESRIDKFGLQLGWRDPNKFRSLMLDYRAEWDEKNPGYSQAFDLTAEYALGNLAGRFNAGMKWHDKGGSSADVNLLTGYKVHDDWRVLGGVGYKTSEQNGQRSGGMYLQTGVQYKSIPLVITVDPSDKKVTFGVTIPLGR